MLLARPLAAAFALGLLPAAACSSRSAPPADAPVTAPTSPPTPPASADAAPECLEELRVEHDESVLQEQRRVGPHAQDFQREFTAATIDPATFTPVKATAAYTIDGRPLLWFNPERTLAVVDATRFGPLTAVDATRLGAGERRAIGRFLAREGLGGRTLARFLVAAGVVQVYAHIGADVCFEREDVTDGAYALTVSGVHTYFTNERNDVRFRFVFRVAADGEMTLEGLARD